VNLLLLDPNELDSDGGAVLADARAAHLIRVLNVAPGERIRAGVIQGGVGEAEILTCETDRVSLKLLNLGPPPAPPRVDLLLAVPRPKVMKRLWAPLAALGVGRIVLTTAARVERCYFDTHILEPSFYRPLLIEGLQQARDTRLPDVVIHRAFRPLVEDAHDPIFNDEIRLVAHPGVEDRIRSLVPEPSAGRAVIAIGPEGGWVPFELDLLGQRGFQPVSIGARTLRTDTACIALLSLLHDRLRD